MSADVQKKLETFLKEPIKAINLGLSSFYDALDAQGMDAIHLDWRPPAGGNPDLLRILDKLTEPAVAERIEKANNLAVERIMAGDPVLEDVVRAGDVIPELKNNTVLHGGPAIAWEEMWPSMRGTIITALVFEAIASSPEEAVALIESGKVVLSPGHKYGVISGISGVATASMPLYVVRNRAFDNVAYCAWRGDRRESVGRYLPEVFEDLTFLRDTLIPVMSAAVRSIGGLEVRPLLAQGLLMGDDNHTRVVAGTSVLVRSIAHLMIRASDPAAAADVLEYFSKTDNASVAISMAACKCIMDSAANIEWSTVVTNWARNGKEDGIQVSGLGQKWFTGPAQAVEGTYSSPYTSDDAMPVMGDSCITECAGFGGLASAAALVASMDRENPDAAHQITRDMYEITSGKNPSYPIPALGFKGVPVGIDIRKVVESGILPISNNPSLHKTPEVAGIIGFGMTQPPIEAFTKALTAFAETYCL